MATSDSWTTIESDPGVFTELLERIGVQGAEVRELYAVEGSMLRELEPVYGLIFLFKWQPNLTTSKPATEADAPVYFAQQIINNACATQAMLSILLNQPDAELDIGEQLKQLRTFTQDFPAEMRGIAIGNADGIRTAHNSFAPPEAALSDNETRAAGTDDDLYHFISFIHAAGSVWELDGLQAGPIRCCDCPHNEWLDRAADVINARIALYAAKEIRFNLMALVKDQRISLQDRLAKLDAELAGAEDEDLRSARLRDKCDVLDALRMKQEEREQWHAENRRRKHNYIPLVFNILQVLAERDELMPLVQHAKQKSSHKPVSSSIAGT